LSLGISALDITEPRPLALPSVVILDSQSVKTTERGSTRGFDGHKRVKGRKRHLLVDTLGMVVARRVEAANVSDRRVGARLTCRLTILIPEHPDGDGRCQLREPQVGARAKTASRVATAHHQTPAARLQGGGPDLDRGAHVCVALKPKRPSWSGSKTRHDAATSGATSNAEIDDPTLYDVTLNTGRLGFARAAEVIAQLALQHRHAFAERER
jgi:Transposase DDE domain